MRMTGCLLLWGWIVLASAAVAGPFALPTTNRFLLEPGAEDRFFAPTAGRTWESGGFGCVRNDRYGPRLHEGIDILTQIQDRQGEPVDPVLASADGVVAYVNRRAGESAYGIYVVLRHAIERLEVYTLYAHLGGVEPGIEAGVRVASGGRIGTMGRTANTRESIAKYRAHLHFEIALVIHDRFLDWYRESHPGSPNVHGNFNGLNLLGIDPAGVFREQERLGADFSLVAFLRGLPVMCRVVVRKADFPWVRRYRALVDPNPVAARDGTAGYELWLAFTGLPVRAIPRSAAELDALGPGPVVSVDPEVWESHPCGRVLARQGQGWTIQARGRELLELLTR